jgi:hypothetical protein
MFTVSRLIIYIGDCLVEKAKREIFDRNTSFAKNIVVKFPADTKLCFSFIDGNHDPEYVKSGFSLAWGSTVPGGIVAFHDSQTGVAVRDQRSNELIQANMSAIRDTCKYPRNCHDGGPQAVDR